jgi:N4-gp56 family major capsid protein
MAAPAYTPQSTASPFPTGSAVTGTPQVAGGGDYSIYGQATGYDVPSPADGSGSGGYGTAVLTPSSMLGPAIQVIWSKEILFQAMPVLRFEQFATKKTELGVMPGLTVNFMRYNNLPVPSGPLVEGVRMRTYALSAQQYQIKVAEQGFAVSVTELLLNASFDDVMASASRLLGRNMALYIDTQARTSLQRSTSAVYGYQKPSVINTGYGVYEPGTPGTAGAVVTGANFYLTMHTIKDAVEVLASKNIPRLGETYVAFVHPHQSRRLRDTPEFIEVTKYAAPGNFMLGEIGRLADVVFIETTQIGAPYSSGGAGWGTGSLYSANPADPSYSASYWRTDFQSGASGTGPSSTTDIDQPTIGAPNPPVTAKDYASVGPGAIATPGWGQFWPGGGATPPTTPYEGLMIGDNAFGHAISLPVELRDGGVLDFGREHALAWYGIWGFGTITESAVVRLVTN